MAASPGYKFPSDEFHRNSKPRFLEEQLAESLRAMDEKRREAAAKKRLFKEMRDKLGGKR